MRPYWISVGLTTWVWLLVCAWDEHRKNRKVLSLACYVGAIVGLYVACRQVFP